MSEAFSGDLVADGIAHRKKYGMSYIQGDFVAALKQYNEQRMAERIDKGDFFDQLRARWKREGIARRDYSEAAALKELAAIKRKLVLHCDSCGAPENAGVKCEYCGSKYQGKGE